MSAFFSVDIPIVHCRQVRARLDGVPDLVVQLNKAWLAHAELEDDSGSDLEGGRIILRALFTRYSRVRLLHYDQR